MNSIHSRRSSVNFTRSRRALVQPRFLLAMTAMASAVGGISYLATAQTGRTPVKMSAPPSIKKASKPVNLRDLPQWVKSAGATGRLATKTAPAKSGRTAQAVVSGNNVSGFNLNDIDLTANTPSDEREPLFSPDGELITFRSNGADSNRDGLIDSVNNGAGNGAKYHIWVMNSDGTNQRQLTGLVGNADAGRNQFRPSWSPDGNQLVYIDGDGTSAQLFVVNALESSTPQPEQRTFFTGEKKSPAWSPNGLVITFASKTNPATGANLPSFDLFSIDPGGDASTAQRLTGGSSDPGGNDVDDLNPAYSVQNSSSIYFSSNRDNNGKISGRRIWQLDGSSPFMVTDPSQRPGFRSTDTVSDDFPTLSRARNFSIGGNNPTNNFNRNVTEQLAFQTDSRLNDSDSFQDLNIWGIPRSSLPETSGAAFILTNSLSSPATAQPGVANGSEDFAPDREPSFSRSIESPQSIGTLAFASQRFANPNPTATRQNPTGGNGITSTNDIFVTGTVDTTPPVLVPQSIGNQDFPVVSPTATLAGEGRGNPRTFEAGLRAGAPAGTSGSLKLAVVINERESGLDRNSSVVAVIRNADRLQTALRDSPVNEEVLVQTAPEIGYEQTNTYALTAFDDGVNERQAGAVAGDGVFYCAADVETPASGEYYIDIVVTDQKQNTFTYDNIWGFSTRPFVKGGINRDLLVSDYTVGQRFVNTLSGARRAFEGGDDGRFVRMDPIESYLIKANGPNEEFGTATPPKNDFVLQDRAQANAFPNADVYRILCRGPVTASLLSSYRPSTTVQIDPNETSFGSGGPFTAKTRKLLVASSSITWASPYTGLVFAGPGTLVDAATQNLLTEFSNAGGRLFVMGRDVGFGLTSGGTVSNDFLRNVLGADWGGDVPTAANNLVVSGRAPGVSIKGEEGGFIVPIIDYGSFVIGAIPDLLNLQVPFHFEQKEKLTDNWDDASLNLNPNTLSFVSSEGGGIFFANNQAVGVMPDELVPSGAGGATIQPSYSVDGRIVGHRLTREVAAGESRSVLFGFGLESVNRRYRKPTKEIGFVALDARAAVVRGINSYLKTGSITGTVINAATNLPIPNFLVRITLEDDPNVIYLARTDNAGKYAISGLSQQVGGANGGNGYRVDPAIIRSTTGKLLPLNTLPGTAVAGGGTAQTSPSGFFAGTSRRNIAIIGGSASPNANLRPIPIRPGSLRGKVVTTDPSDPRKQVAANGLNVLIRSTTALTPGGSQYANVVKTDAAGNFSFAGVPALIDLEVVLNPTIGDIPEKSGLRSRFTPPAFTGTFQNPELERRVITGLNRPTGSATPPLQVPNNGTFVLNDSSPDNNLDSGTPLLLGRFLATLTGKVTVNGVATSNVTVELLTSAANSFSPARTTLTDSQGSYSLDRVPAGSYIVKATTRLGATARSAVFTIANNSTTVNITVRTINIVAPILSGKVNLKQIGASTVVKALPNATVELLNSAGKSFAPSITTTSDSVGKYSFIVSLNGSYKVRATIELAGSSSTATTPDFIKVTGNVTAPDLVITRYQISGTVVSSSGAVQPRAIVEVSVGDNTIRSITSDSGGKFVFSNLLPGSYTVKAFASATAGSATGSQTVLIKTGDLAVPAIKITLNGTSTTGPTGGGTGTGTGTGNGTGTDGGGSVGRTFAANGAYTISLPYAIDNVLGTLTVNQAFSPALTTTGYQLYSFNAAKQVNNLSKDLVRITDGNTKLVRGQGYYLVTGASAVTLQTPTQNSTLKSFAGTTFNIPLTWNTTFLSDTSEPDNRNNGYNLIGFPFNPALYGSVSFTGSKVKYGDITYNSIDEATAAGVISRQLYTITSGVRTAVPFDDLNIRAFNGYFVRILRKDQPVTLILQNPVK